ncbi:solute carrier family 23 member 3 isoform X2 [Erinaceus europaeus]|uniref:Solute carrier family 23 member 3 isoform X2 n=1 Tax=Erinaceus europaeus TaxID=9365 RepID=A0ABM3XM09_ERIEU|nr:solute carrier family 23 member 3 isoform X2 [Erinaceus europaeus]
MNMSMTRAPSQSSPLRGPRDAPAPADSGPYSHSSAPPWGLSCLLALQHLLVLLSVLCASHLLLLRSLSPGGLSYPPAQLLASSLFSCGVSTAVQACMGSRLPLVQAPSFEFLIPALVMTSQKLPVAIRTPGNCVWGSGTVRAAAGDAGASGRSRACVCPLWAPGAGPWPGCGGALCPQGSGPILLHSLGPGLIAYPAPGGLFPASGLLPTNPTPLEATVRLFRSQLCPCLPAPLGADPNGLCVGPLVLSWPWRHPPRTICPHPGSVALDASPGGVGLALADPRGPGCGHVYGLGRLCQLPGLLCPLWPAAASAFTTCTCLQSGAEPGRAGQHVGWAAGESSGCCLQLPQSGHREPLSGWSPVDVFLRSLLREPIFLAALLGFLLENTVPGTRHERGLDQGLAPSSTAPGAWLPRKSREKAAAEYTLPFPTPNLCACVPQPLRHCLCPQPGDQPGNEEGGTSEPGETADLLSGLGEQYYLGPNREPRSQ